VFSQQGSNRARPFLSAHEACTGPSGLVVQVMRDAPRLGAIGTQQRVRAWLLDSLPPPSSLLNERLCAFPPQHQTPVWFIDPGLRRACSDRAPGTMSAVAVQPSFYDPFRIALRLSHLDQVAEKMSTVLRRRYPCQVNLRMLEVTD